MVYLLIKPLGKSWEYFRKYRSKTFYGNWYTCTVYVNRWFPSNPKTILSLTIVRPPKGGCMVQAVLIGTGCNFTFYA